MNVLDRALCKRAMRALRVALVLAGLVPFSAQAASLTLTMELDIEFSGATAPAGPAPWMSAVFDDATGNPNSVEMTLSNFGLIDQESVGEWLFNFDPLLDPTLLTVNVIDDFAINPQTAIIELETDAHMADGDGMFDIRFAFPPPTGNFNKRFTGGEVMIYEFVFPEAIDVNSFNFESVMGGGAGTFITAAQVQSIGATGESGWVGAPVTAPEPSLLLLLGVGAFGLTALRSRRKSP